MTFVPLHVASSTHTCTFTSGEVNAGILYGSDSTIATNLSDEIYTGGVSYQLSMAFGLSASVNYKGHFAMAFVDANDKALATLEFDASELTSQRLTHLSLDYTVEFGSTGVGQAVRVSIQVSGQGPTPVFTRIRYD